MRIPLVLLILLSISLLGSCTTQKAKVFGTDMPSMTMIHDKKFGQSEVPIQQPLRPLSDTETHSPDFVWLPNPTLYLYVFEHISDSGLPVPGYITFFKFYTTDHIARPSERVRWKP